MPQFSPNNLFSHISNQGGLAKPSRFQVILPIPLAINSFIGNSVIDKLLNIPNPSIFSKTDITNKISSLSKNALSLLVDGSTSKFLSLQCETAELPGRNIQTSDVKIYGPTFKIPTQTTFADTTLTFLCTNKFYERRIFERWMESIHPLDTNNFRFPKGDTTRYLTNIQIDQFDEGENIIYSVQLLDAFPIAISPQALNWAEDGFHRLSIQFAYYKYIQL